MKVFLTGGSGYIGQATIPALIAAGHTVSALARNEAATRAVAARGADPVTGGLGDLEVLTHAAAAADAVIHLAQQRGPETAAVDRAAADALQDGAKERPYIHTGGLWIYGDTDGVIDEDAPFAPPPIVAWRLQTEARVLARAAAGGHPIIVMPGVVYGHSQGLIENLLVTPAREQGIASYIDSGENHWPLVHVDDIAVLYVLALSAPAGTRWAGVSDSSRTMAQVAAAASHAAGCGGKTVSVTLAQARVTMGGVADAFAQDQQISGDRARRQLGWAPAHLQPLRELVEGL